jgi:hypothetical protein
MKTFKAKVGSTTLYVIAKGIADAYKRVEPYYKEQTIVITSMRKRCVKQKPLFTWN